MDSGVTLKDAVRSFCERFGRDFDSIVNVEMDEPGCPTKLTVWFKGDPNPMTMEIKYPQNS